MKGEQKYSDMVMEAPKNWLQMIENIRAVRQKYPAPVDSMGCDQVHKVGETDVHGRFQVLVSLMLSSQTKDQITWGAVQKLKSRDICSVDGLLKTDEKDIEDLIYPVGFYRRKAVGLKKVAAILKDQYDSDIPSTIEGLVALPGVGPKMAHLCMQEAWNVNSGIGVDTHVHRIAARLGWVPPKNVKSPEHTRAALESWLPREYWREINHLLVGFGQTICTPIGPKCSNCANNDICPSASTKSNKSGTTLVKKEAAATPKKKPMTQPRRKAPKKKPKEELIQVKQEYEEVPVEVKKEPQPALSSPQRCNVEPIDVKKEPVEIPTVGETVITSKKATKRVNNTKRLHEPELEPKQEPGLQRESHRRLRRPRLDNS